MKYLMTVFAVLFAIVFTANTAKAQFANDAFRKVIYVSGVTAGKSGANYSSPKPFVTGNLWAIPADTVISKVYLVVDTAITGTSVLAVGDTDGSTSFCPNASITLGTPGMYCWDAKSAGAYLRISTNGASVPQDLYVVPNAKYYAAAGKFVTLANTTTNTAGQMRVVIEGYRLHNLQ